MDNPAHDVLERKLATIKESNVDPAWLAGELLSAGIVGPEDEERARMEGRLVADRRAALVLSVLRNGERGAFQTFVETLFKRRHLESLARELKGIDTLPANRKPVHLESPYQPMENVIIIILL